MRVGAVMEAVRAVTSVDDEGTLTEAEIKAAFAALTDTDLLRLRRADDYLRQGTDFAEGDLTHGAICQAILGERKCPREVGFVQFIVMAMRSAAGHRRTELKRSVPFDAPASFSGDRGMAAPTDWLQTDGLDPEAHLIESERTSIVDAIMAKFEGDKEAQLVIKKAAEGLKGAALCKAVGVTSNRLHYVLRKIRKKLGADPDGWKS
jgi:hypothetical protein